MNKTQKALGGLGKREGAKGREATRLQWHNHVSSPPSLWSLWSESFNNVKKKNEGGDGVEKGWQRRKGFTCRVWGTESLVGLNYMMVKVQRAWGRDQRRNEHAACGRPRPAWSLHAGCKCVFLCHLPSAFPHKVASAVPSKKHPDPLGTGRDPQRGKSVSHGSFSAKM